MKATARTVVKTEAKATEQSPVAALSLEFKRRVAEKSEAAAARPPASIKEALVRWLEEEL